MLSEKPIYAYNNIVNFSISIIYILYNNLNKNTYLESQSSDDLSEIRNHIIEINIDEKTVQAGNFGISNNTKQILFDLGFETTKTFLKKNV